MLFAHHAFAEVIRSKIMHRITTQPAPAFHPESGIDAIAHQSVVQPIFLAGVELQPPEQSDRSELARLFPLRSYEDFIWERLTPAFAHAGFLQPARFRQTLVMLRQSIRALAKQHHSGSRRYGRLAHLLDDQDELTRLAHMYFSSLLQG